MRDRSGPQGKTRDARACQPPQHVGAAPHHRLQHGQARLETTGPEAGRKHQRSRQHRGPIDGTEVTERTAMKFGGNQPMRKTRGRGLLFSAVAALALYPALSPVIAADSDTQPETTAAIADGGVKSRFL